MFALSAHLRFFLYRHPTDMRKSFDGLCGLIASGLGKDPLSGDVYVFVNRRRDRIKLLLWDRSGFWICYKRLEQGTFQLPAPVENSDALRLPYETLVMILEGIDLRAIRRRRRFQLASPP